MIEYKFIETAFEADELDGIDERLYKTGKKIAERLLKRHRRHYSKLTYEVKENFENKEYQEEIQKLIDILAEKGFVGVYAIGANKKERFEKLELEPFGSSTAFSVATGNINLSGAYFFVGGGVIVRAYQFKNKNELKTGYEMMEFQKFLDGLFEISKKPFNDLCVDYFANMFYSICKIKETPFETMKGCFDGYEM